MFKTSIAMATYNGEDYLEEQIESFFNQKNLPDELIIYDDCSVDSTIPIINKMTENALFRMSLNQNKSPLGYAQNFNKALTSTAGEIIFLSDQDDVWFDTKLAEITKAFERAPGTYLIIHDLEYCDEKLTPVGQTKLERLKSIGASHRSYVTGMATAIRREFLDICLPIPSNPLITHDLWLHECAYVLDVKTVLPQVLASYRRHSSNATGGTTLNRSTKTSFFSFISRVDFVTTKTAIDRRIDVSQALLNWLASPVVLEFYKNTVAGDIVGLEKKRQKIKLELAYAKKRRALLDKNILFRLTSALSLYFQGGYEPFMGSKSLIKDIWLRK